MAASQVLKGRTKLPVSLMCQVFTAAICRRFQHQSVNLRRQSTSPDPGSDERPTWQAVGLHRGCEISASWVGLSRISRLQVGPCRRAASAFVRAATAVVQPFASLFVGPTRNRKAYRRGRALARRHDKAWARGNAKQPRTMRRGRFRARAEGNRQSQRQKPSHRIYSHRTGRIAPTALAGRFGKLSRPFTSGRHLRREANGALSLRYGRTALAPRYSSFTIRHIGGIMRHGKRPIDQA
jgi:hypothetical protein